MRKIITHEGSTAHVDYRLTFVDALWIIPVAVLALQCASWVADFIYTIISPFLGYV